MRILYDVNYRFAVPAVRKYRDAELFSALGYAVKMASWNRIQSGFAADDETVNFGTRLIAESNGSLYETRTVATIASTEKVDQQPNVLACFQHIRLYVAIDKSLTIFKDETCDEILCSINFHSTIVCYCISKDGFFLFVILTNRVLYCLHLPDGKIIFTKNISDNEDNIIQIFLKEENKETFIILITAAGAIYRFSQFYPKALQSAFINDDKAVIAKHITNIECSQLFKGFTSPEFLCATVNTVSEELSITMIGTNSIFTWPNNEYNNFHQVFSFGYKKIKPLHSSDKMLCLRTDHVLTIVCPNTLLGLKICDSPVLDFTVIQHDATSCEILFLTSSKHNSSMHTLCLISFPDYEQKLEINIPNTSHLLEDAHACDYIYYIEGIAGENKIIDTFRVKAITESVPEMRLARLLKKKQFDTAEAFAERMGLSAEPIYCSKAASIIDELSPWSNTPDSVDVNSLINILDKIQSVQYVAECCSKALISDHTQMKRIYVYAQQRIIQEMKEKKQNAQSSSQLSLISDTLYRFETFRMIQDNETDVLLKDSAVLNKWIRFSQADLLEECTAYLSVGQLKPATLIWTRHFRDMVKRVTAQRVRDILGMLPEDTAPSSLWPWLTHFVPTLLSLLPDAIDEIMSWGVKKLKCLEMSHRAAWPEVGIEFATQFVRLLRFENHQSATYLRQEYSCQNPVLMQLMFLLQALSDIKQLKVAYSLRVPLDMYVGSPREAIYLLLDKIHLNEIPNFVNTFLKEYTLNSNLQTDAVLCSYIQKTTKHSNGWWVDEEVLWEKRVIILINLIHNIENRLEQTLAVLKKVPVPWSPAVAALAETSSSLDHGLCFKIKIERDYVPIKLVLKKYGYATIGVNNKLMSRVIKEDRDCMIDDIDVLTRNDKRLKRDAFCRCINARLNEGNLQKAINVMRHVESNTADALYCYEGIVNYVVAALSLQIASTSLTCHMEMLSYIEFKIRNLSQQSDACVASCRIIGAIKDVKSLYLLKKDYKVDVSLKTYRAEKSLVLQDCITELLSSMKKSDLPVILETVAEIAELLGLEKSHATSALLEKIGNTDAYLYLLQFLLDNVDDLSMKTEELKNVYKMCLSALQHVAVNTNIVEVIKRLSVLMLNTCRDSDLQSASTLHNCISICRWLSSRCGFDAGHEVAPVSRWKLYTIYKDQAISLDQKLVSFLNEAISLHVFYSDQTDNYRITGSEEHMDQVLNDFLESTRTIQLQHNEYSLLQIFKTFYFTYHCAPARNEVALTKMRSVLYQLSTNLLKKLCTGRSFDLHLGLSCLFMLPEEEACTWLSATSTLFQADYIRHSTISTLGYEHSRLRRDQESLQTYERYKLLHIWAQRLSDYSIAYKEIWTSDTSRKREILQEIINSDKENVTTVLKVLKDYCCSFGFNFNDCLLLYLQTLLKTWCPTVTVSNTSTNKELIISKEEVDELRNKCAIVAQMEDRSALKQSVSVLWDQINFYHYEVFIILMDLIDEKSMSNRNYLCFLQNYTRSGSPTPLEHDEWMHINPGHNTLPSIAQWRLPFLRKVDVWKIITPELNLRTYEKWLGIAPVLNLETHLICTLAIKGEVNRVWGNTVKSKNTTWSLHLRNSTLLGDIKRCIQRMSDADESRYYGTAALYYAVNYTPPGADCVAVAGECYKYARLAANSPKFEKGMLQKIKSKYLAFTSEHILRTHGLDKDKYLALIENPPKLVYELYSDESIPLRYRAATKYRPDINGAFDKLCELFSLNVIGLRLNLLHEWLQSNVRFTELLSQSFTETVTLKQSDQNIDHDMEDNLLRTRYMLEYEGMDKFIQVVINIGFGENYGETEYNYNVRYRVLRVLQTVIDTSTLEKLTARDTRTFRNYIKTLEYVCKLESIGVCYTIDEFERCSKRELVQILWRTQRYSPCALSVTAQICIEFQIHDILLWDNVLDQMAKLRMVNDLKRVLLQLQSENVILDDSGYKTGWQLIVAEPFGEMDVNPSPEQINHCVEAICLLYSCPVAHELDFAAVVRICFQCKQACLAAALLPFLSESEKKFVLETINQKYEIAELFEGLNRLSSEGVLTVDRSIAIIKTSAQQR